MFNLDEIVDRKWMIQGCSFINMIGVTEGFEWLSKNVEQFHKTYLIYLIYYQSILTNIMIIIYITIIITIIINT